MEEKKNKLPKVQKALGYILYKRYKSYSRGPSYGYDLVVLTDERSKKALEEMPKKTLGIWIKENSIYCKLPEENEIKIEVNSNLNCYEDDEYYVKKKGTDLPSRIQKEITRAFQKGTPEKILFERKDYIFTCTKNLGYTQSAFQNIKASMLLIQEASELGHPSATWCLEKSMIGRRSQEEWEKIIEKIASLGHRETIWLLGYRYLEGLSTSDKGGFSKGISLLEKAAEQNHLLAISTLAEIYAEGQYGIEVDFYKASTYYKKIFELLLARATRELLPLNTIKRIDRFNHYFQKLLNFFGNKLKDKATTIEVLEKGVLLLRFSPDLSNSYKLELVARHVEEKNYDAALNWLNRIDEDNNFESTSLPRVFPYPKNWLVDTTGTLHETADNCAVMLDAKVTKQKIKSWIEKEEEKHKKCMPV
ncbi:MAG: sel1 repeat family protein [Alphaproteobacteria bacterium]|nr:sel1 repeat family protein [Alphaproteobacteria bacterium]